MNLTALHRGTQTFESAHGIGEKRRKPITNLMADRLLLETPEAFRSSGAVWTGTIVAYPVAGATFGHDLEYSCRPARYVMDTSDFRGIRGVALMFEDFELRVDGGTSLFLPKGKPLILEGFPQESGWSPMHKASGIPLLKGDGGPRFLFRLAGARIGPVVRDLGPDGKSKLDVYLHHRLSQKLGALIIDEDFPGSLQANVLRLPVSGRK